MHAPACSANGAGLIVLGLLPGEGIATVGAVGLPASPGIARHCPRSPEIARNCPLLRPGEEHGAVSLEGSKGLLLASATARTPRGEASRTEAALEVPRGWQGEAARSATSRSEVRRDTPG